MEIDFDKDPKDMSDNQVDIELASMTAKDSPYWANGPHPLKDKYQTRVTALYGRKNPEPSGRQSEMEDARGLSDILRKEGLNSPEQIKEEVAQARGVASQEKFDAAVRANTDILRSEWGTDYEKNLKFARGFFKEVGIEDIDRDWLNFSPPDGTPALANNAEFIKAFLQVGKLLSEYNAKHRDDYTRFIKSWKPRRK